MAAFAPFRWKNFVFTCERIGTLWTAMPSRSFGMGWNIYVLISSVLSLLYCLYQYQSLWIEVLDYTKACANGYDFIGQCLLVHLLSCGCFPHVKLYLKYSFLRSKLQNGAPLTHNFLSKKVEITRNWQWYEKTVIGHAY